LASRVVRGRGVQLREGEKLELEVQSRKVVSRVGVSWAEKFWTQRKAERQGSGEREGSEGGKEDSKGGTVPEVVISYPSTGWQCLLPFTSPSSDRGERQKGKEMKEEDISHSKQRSKLPYIRKLDI